ncbi:integrase family protein [Methylophilus sp. 5]|uniref:tyrosine-type recombinase/integrase n=1 Tax=Methylophilus sp. 5 TaxID=1112274 RepID=UPI0004AC6CA7|nr:integrase family protein [Methylophilus sp. 5]
MAYKITKTLVDSIPFPDSGQMFYRDSELKGFGVRVGSNSKVYFAESKINNKTVRVTIGHHGIFTAEQAKNEAKNVLGMIARGINPNDISKAEKAKSVTVNQAFEQYLKARSDLKARTIYDYQRFMKTYFKEWENKPLIDISKDLIEKKHRSIGERSPAQANLAMRFMRALFNFANGKYEDSEGNSIIADNPIKRLSQTRSWYKIERRQTVIKASDLPTFLNAVMELPNYSPSLNSLAVKDYLLLLLFTGLRREEALSLEWKNVDLKNKTFTLPDPKNRQPHTLPLTPFLQDLLQKRFNENAGNSEFVFPSTGIKGYMNDPRPQMNKVTEKCGVKFTPHDLRRTFITIAESLDISAYALKRLANHKMSNDVTAGYIIGDVERLRSPMQRITDYLLKTIKTEA